MTSTRYSSHLCSVIATVATHYSAMVECKKHPINTVTHGSSQGRHCSDPITFKLEQSKVQHHRLQIQFPLGFAISETVMGCPFTVQCTGSVAQFCER